MKYVFIDTTPLGAFDNPLDQHYEKSKEILDDLIREETQLVTTDYVIDEVATLLISKVKGGYHLAVNLLEWIFTFKSGIRIEWIDKIRFKKAKAIFKRFNKDKDWSFTDCTSYVIMKELKIDTAFTFDAHFKQMGFKIL
ncbi:MAG: PilT protein domain protein [Microgenomates group bacterium GW2011_GWC1_37_8]|uniref:PilT protein domain protein n=1 Tax=Candidatus Woesebacteria bacterium GW2011_GWB1_38_8 TaxID=1618570 RepID=A0A0G0LCD0_9BACT|nr:MAG: PilT protein domain protein [Microgenomates group bacterium GW2011_GWC1_37_8]KKQ85560.1 MAG: PilT protein domain protein [Candidatus Woesebacteria bacterium GW2011_GWB1_38_8]